MNKHRCITSMEAAHIHTLCKAMFVEHGHGQAAESKYMTDCMHCFIKYYTLQKAIVNSQKHILWAELPNFGTNQQDTTSFKLVHAEN